MQTKQRLDVPLSLKSVSDSGEFEGYGSVFGVKDSHDDVVMSGALLLPCGRGVTEKRYLRCSGSTAWMSHRCLHRNEGRRCRALRQGAVAH